MKAAVSATVCIALLALSSAAVGAGESEVEGGRVTARKQVSVPALEEVVRVVYQIELLPARYLVVSDEDSVRAIVGLLEFETKEPCECAHYEAVTLEYPDDTVEFSVCSHCLDYKGNFKMPAELWKMLQAIREREGVGSGD